MNAIGSDSITPVAIAEQGSTFTGPLVMGSPTGVECGMNSAEPAVCNDQAKFYQYEGQGQFTSVSDWLTPP